MTEIPQHVLMDRAIAHHQVGRLQEAQVIYRQILASDPECADAVHLLGVVALQAGQLETAVKLIQDAIALEPRRAAYHSNLGEAYSRLGQAGQAVASFRQALALQPRFPAAMNNLAVLLSAQNQLAEAISLYEKVLRIEPDHVDANHNLGNYFLQQGEYTRARACLARALKRDPNRPDTLFSLGNVLTAQGALAEAVNAYQQAIVLRPNFAFAHCNLGVVYKEQDQYELAEKSFERALDADPNYAEAHNNLAGLLKDSGRIEEALGFFRRAIELKPGYVDAHSNLVMAMLYHPDCDAATITAELDRWNVRHARDLSRNSRPLANDPSPGRRLRIGYVSPDLHDHVVGRNLLPLFEHQTHENFEYFAYAQASRNDGVTERLKAGCDHWLDITRLSDTQLVDQIRKDRIDVLIDLAIHTSGNRLLAFARKPAPVQASFAAYPGQSGLDAIEYHLTDPFLEAAESRPSGISRPVRLPASFWCYEGMAVDLPVGELPALKNGYVTFGSLNNFCKFNRAALPLWARVLQGVPSARFLLYCPMGGARTRVTRLFQNAGVSPDRIEFVARQSRESYLATYNRIDITLDSYPYNGHTTSLDSLWMGVPVVSAAGSRPVSRAGWSQLSNLGMAEFAALRSEDYARIAIALAGDVPRLAEIRRGLREKMRQSPLMDGAGFARGVEAAYREMWQTWCSRQGDRASLGL